MKRTIFVLAVLVLAAPALADTVSIEATHEGSGVVRIDYAVSDANLVRGFALNVTVDTNVITACTPYLEGECNSVKKGYGIFPGTIDINAVTGIVEGFGTPVSDPCEPDNPGQLGTSSIVLEMGSLYSPTGAPNAPPTSGTLCWLTVAGDCNMSVTVEDTLRGGIVMEDAGVTVDANLVLATNVSISGVTECLKSSDPGYTYWKADFGSPDCWCFRKQCNADADGLLQMGKPVGTDDLGLFKLAFGQTVAALQTVSYKGVPGICADFDHAKQMNKPVGTDDLTLLKEYFGDSDASVPMCPDTHINFWTN